MSTQRVPKDSALSRVLAQRTGNWLAAHIDDHLERTGEYRHDPGWFHPSALGNPCDAFLAFTYMGITGKGSTPARLQRIFHNGHARDRDWKNYLRESGVSLVLKEEDRLIEIPHLKIRGELDDMVFNPVTKEKFIFEFKTMNAKEWEELREPKGEHVTQVHPYMFAKGILQAIIVYENKNTQELKQFIRRFDGALWHSIELRLLNIMDLVEKKQLPWRTPMQNDSRCQFYWTCSGFEFKEE